MPGEDVSLVGQLNKDVELEHDRQGRRLLGRSFTCARLERLATQFGCDSDIDLECFDCVVFFGVPNWVKYDIYAWCKFCTI